MSIIRETITAIRATLVLWILTALIYPFFLIAIGQVAFPYQANGSLITNQQGEIVGSALIGQPFASDRLSRLFSLIINIILIMNYRNYITLEPNKRGGKPCVRGLRITVYKVLEYLASEMSEAEILDDFPDLTREDLKACIAYAADRERRFMTAPLSS